VGADYRSWLRMLQRIPEARATFIVAGATLASCDLQDGGTATLIFGQPFMLLV
jgi:hypothetical protein